MRVRARRRRRGGTRESLNLRFLTDLGAENARAQISHVQIRTRRTLRAPIRLPGLRTRSPAPREALRVQGGHGNALARRCPRNRPRSAQGDFVRLQTHPRVRKEHVAPVDTVLALQTRPLQKRVRRPLNREPVTIEDVLGRPDRALAEEDDHREPDPIQREHRPSDPRAREPNGLRRKRELTPHANTHQLPRLAQKRRRTVLRLRKQLETHFVLKRTARDRQTQNRGRSCEIRRRFGRFCALGRFPRLLRIPQLHSTGSAHAAQVRARVVPGARRDDRLREQRLRVCARQRRPRLLAERLDMPDELLLRQDRLEVRRVVHRQRKDLHLSVLHQVPEPEVHARVGPLAARRPAKLSAQVRGNAETHRQSPLCARFGRRRVVLRVSRERKDAQPEAARDVEDDGDEGGRPVETRGRLNARGEPGDQLVAWNVLKCCHELDAVVSDEEELCVEYFSLNRLQIALSLPQRLRGRRGSPQKRDLRLPVSVSDKYLNVVGPDVVNVAGEHIFSALRSFSENAAGTERPPRPNDRLEEAEPVQARPREARPLQLL